MSMVNRVRIWFFLRFILYDYSHTDPLCIQESVSRQAQNRTGVAPPHPVLRRYSPAVFLASSASDFVNGHVLYVDGGILAYIGKNPMAI